MAPADPPGDLPELPIYNLDERHRGVTDQLAPGMAEGARVCLDRHHTPPTEMTIDDSDNRTQAIVAWEPTDPRTRDAWSDQNDPIEDGATACALAAVELRRGFLAVRRAHRHTGADYYIGPPGISPDNVQDMVRLEVSGVDRQDAHTVRSRLTGKLRQMHDRDPTWPGIAAVVGFRERLILMADLSIE